MEFKKQIILHANLKPLPLPLHKDHARLEPRVTNLTGSLDDQWLVCCNMAITSQVIARHA